ncbi:hypothetical protein MNV49_005491 [Pseudohyphozyma bogoriensis]|nr:hypothetical protein MNV49_005491 [Pseudohyphozyma bogoriensis]
MADSPDDVDSQLSRQFRKSSTIDSTTSVGSSSSTSGSTHSTSTGRTSLSSIFSHHSSHSSSSSSHKHSKKHREPLTSHDYTTPGTPIALVQSAIELLCTYPSVYHPDEFDKVLDRVYHKSYVHRVNNREMGMDGLRQTLGSCRARFRSVRVRFRSTLMDGDGTATMRAAAVGVTYDILGTPINAPKHDAEEKRMPAMAVVKVYDGKIAQTDLVLDTIAFQSMDATELSCNIM